MSAVVQFYSVEDFLAEVQPADLVRVQVQTWSKQTELAPLTAYRIGVHVTRRDPDTGEFHSCYLATFVGTAMVQAEHDRERLDRARERAEEYASRLRAELEARGAVVRPGRYEIGDVHPVQASWTAAQEVAHA